MRWTVTRKKAMWDSWQQWKSDTSQHWTKMTKISEQFYRNSDLGWLKTSKKREIILWCWKRSKKRNWSRKSKQLSWSRLTICGKAINSTLQSSGRRATSTCTRKKRKTRNMTRLLLRFRRTCLLISIKRKRCLHEMKKNKGGCKNTAN